MTASLCARRFVTSLCVAGLLAGIALVIPSATAQTVPPPGQWTVIIHGREYDYVYGGSDCGYPGTYDGITAPDGWMRQLAERIVSLNGSPKNIYKMNAADNGLVTLWGTNPFDQSRHHILLFDWAKTSPIDGASCFPVTGGIQGFAYAAGDALYATLRGHDADSKLFCLIGYSRGAIVASETAKRVLRAGRSVPQVIYLDGEGCPVAGGTPSCDLYTDVRFDRWGAPNGTTARFDNIYAEFDENYVDLSGLFCTMNLGGHPRARCFNRSVGTTYAHSDYPGWMSLCWPYDPDGIYRYLIDYLYASAERYAYPDEPSPPTDTTVLDPLADPTPILFNGDFEWGSLAGWLGNGGYGLGTLETAGGSIVARLDAGEAIAHNFFVAPGCLAGVQFDASKSAVTDGSNQVVVTLLSPGAGSAELARFSIASLTGTMQTKGLYAIPQAFRGRACILEILHTSNGGTFANVKIDNVTIIGDLPDAPPNPIVQGSGCSGVTIVRSGSPPPGVTWFWQGVACGQRLDLGSGATFTPAFSGTYYLRARCDVTGTWSASCGSATVSVSGCGLTADFDCDAVVDLDDWTAWRACFAGPSIAPPGGCGGPDFDDDSDVDLRDFAALQVQFGQNCSATGAMALIPAGEFLMGNSFSGEGYSNELPLHAVYVSSFYMDVYQVTNAQYAAALNWARLQGNQITVTGGVVYKYNSGTSYPYCDTNSADSGSCILWNNTTFTVEAGRDNHPVVEVSWYGAVAYCNWRSAMAGKPQCYDLSTWACNFDVAGFRLPTEAEWEKAARGGAAGRRFPWSDQDTIQHARCNYYSSSSYTYDTSPTGGSHPLWRAGSWPYTSPVGFFNGSLRYKADWNWPDSSTSYQTANGANGYGLHDMAGNARQWCNDWYGSSYYQDYVNQGRPPNPRGPASGTYRVLRGGCWYQDANLSRVAVRGNPVPGAREPNYGFRCSLRTP